MATKTKTKPAVSAGPVVSTPVVGAAKSKSAASLLSGLTGKATTKAAAKKPERPEVELSTEAEQLFAEFAPAKELADIFAERAENLKGQLTDEVFKEYVSTMWNGGGQPTNPALKARNEAGQVDCEGIFIVQEKIKVQIPNPENPSESVIDLLSKSGVSEPAARKLVETEIDFTPSVGLRPFNELITGHYEERKLIEATAEEQAVAQKILEFVTNELSDDEKALVLRNEPKTVVKAGFLERVVTYIGSLEELESVFKVLVPVNYPKGAKFAVSDTPVGKTNRLIGKASEILGTN